MASQQPKPKERPSVAPRDDAYARAARMLPPLYFNSTSTRKGALRSEGELATQYLWPELITPLVVCARSANDGEDRSYSSGVSPISWSVVLYEAFRVTTSDLKILRLKHGLEIRSVNTVQV
jgi:hypothetical protein